jgi:hypothetical protein
MTARLLLCVALGATGSAALIGCGGEPDRDGQRTTASDSGPTLATGAVPPDLRHLVPLAREWGIGDDVERLAKVDGATAAQRAELRRAVGPHQARITQWLDSFGPGEMSPEAAMFMYLQLAIEEMAGVP